MGSWTINKNDNIVSNDEEVVKTLNIFLKVRKQFANFMNSFLSPFFVDIEML